MSIEREAICPECGSPLVVSVEKNRKSKEIQIRFFCDGDYDDKFEFVILTGLRQEDLSALEKKGKVEVRQMGVKLLERKIDPEINLSDSFQDVDNHKG
jgi:hypothetical protein